jgi:hypothetical protein
MSPSAEYRTFGAEITYFEMESRPMPIKSRLIPCWSKLMKTAMLLATVLFFGAYAVGDDTPATAPTTAPSTQPSDRSLTAEQMFSKMLRPNPSAARPLQPASDAPAVDKSSGVGAVAPGAPTLNVLREGTYLVDRVGRLNRSSDGTQAEFTFDSDGKTLKDPPVLILPNLKLMTMENAVSSANRDLRFRITGMVTEYRGRNYVLLEKVVVVPDPAQQF